ncbi:MAG: cob(I)yrinic acid a,c-diamide adenosyltransferase [Actinobacteria bacterium]|nr:cob(I)yrinic acid a,c-diamide adenosyltransferase [Actinomycetota bacterium]
MSSDTKKQTRGLVIVNTGNGKGKTTAALGLMFRTWGHNMKVIMLQFIKSSTANCGEHRAAERIGVDVIANGAGFSRRCKDLEKNKYLAINMWTLAKEKIESGVYRMVILDEFTYPIKYKWLSVEEVLDVLRNRPEEVHVVITGRDAPQELIDFADIVTDMRVIKHPLQSGVKAQPGIEM